MKELDFYGLSYIGKRTNNQDHFVAVKLNNEVSFFGVADGMGGVSGGEIASRLVVDSAIAFLKEKANKGIHENDLKSILEEMFKKCQEAIAGQLAKKPDLEGMGSTFVCLLIYKEFYVYGNIGDSRIYQKNKGSLDQISKDHSLIQEYKDKFGKNVPEPISNQSNIITRVIDGRGDLPDIYPINDKYSRLSGNGAFLICSDGLLLDKVDDQENSIFFKYLFGCRNLEETCKQLISYAYHSGSTDNITIVVITNGKLKGKKFSIQKFAYPPTNQQSNQKKSIKKRQILSSRSILAICGLLLFIAAGVFLTYELISPKPSENKAGKDEQVQTNPPSSEASTIIKLKGFLNSNPTTPVDLSSYLLEWDLPTNPEKFDGYTLTVQVNGKVGQGVTISATQSNVAIRSLNLHPKEKVRFTLKPKSRSVSIENSTLELEIQ